MAKNKSFLNFRDKEMLMVVLNDFYCILFIRIQLPVIVTDHKTMSFKLISYELLLFLI